MRDTVPGFPLPLPTRSAAEVAVRDLAQLDPAVKELFYTLFEHFKPLSFRQGLFFAWSFSPA